MSSLLGSTTDRWALSRATDALGEAARQVARPSLAWIAGLFYPSVFLGYTSMWRAGTPGARAMFGPWDVELPALRWASGAMAEDLIATALLTIVIVVVFFPLSRLVAGLARVSTHTAWEQASATKAGPRLSVLWRAGRGLTWSVVGLWTQFVIMMVGAVFALLLPAAALSEPVRSGFEADFDGIGVLSALALGALTITSLVYWLAVSILTQLALHSLAHNRRGVGSALLHAWRIVRHDPWATARAVAIDLVLTVVFGFLVVGLRLSTYDIVGDVLVLAVWGYVGCVRSAYWARAYRALGGLSPDDGVPGL